MAKKVIDQLKLPYSVGQLQSELHAVVPSGTLLIDVTVEDPSPARAKAIADAVDRQFARFLNTIETPQPHGVSSVKVSVTSPADVPTQPVSPRESLYLILGLFLGLILGTVAAVLSEALNRGIRTDEQAEAIAGAPVLASLSDPARGHSSPVVLTAPLSAEADEYRRLAAALAPRSRGGRPPQSLVVSSAVEEEGKTMVAANLAIVFAQDGLRVIAVDANLRRPGLATVLNMAPSPGVTDVIAKRVPLHTALQTADSPLQLEVLAAGSSPSNPGELLASHSFEALLTGLAKYSDIVILDAPPILSSAESLILARLAGDVMLVSRLGSQTDHLETAVGYLGAVGAKVLGVVATPAARAGGFGFGPRPRAPRPGRGESRPAPSEPLPAGADREL